MAYAAALAGVGTAYHHPRPAHNSAYCPVDKQSRSAACRSFHGVAVDVVRSHNLEVGAQRLEGLRRCGPRSLLCGTEDLTRGRLALHEA